MQPNPEFLEAFDEIGTNAHRISNYLDPAKALHHFFPQDAELHFGNPAADAEMRPPTKRKVAGE